MRDFPWADFHTHATRYRAVAPDMEASVQAMARAGCAAGLDMMGVGEHLNGKSKHPLECLLDLAAEYRSAEFPMPVFLGSEIDVLDDRTGRLYGPRDVRERVGLHYVLAAVHRLHDNSSLQEYLDEQHGWLMEATTGDNDADVIAHPWHTAKHTVFRGLVSEWRFELIPERFNCEFIAALAAHGKAVEINNRSAESFQEPAYREFVNDLRSNGVRVAVGSDAHGMDGVQRAAEINAFLEDMEFSVHEIWTPPAAADLTRDWHRTGSESGEGHT